MFNLKEEISTVFEHYVALPTITNTERETLADDFLQSYFQSMPYFEKHPRFCGSELITDDPHNRSVHWAFVKGQGEKTVVLLHHFDVVNHDPYGGMKELAFVPQALRKQLSENPSGLSADAIKDLQSGAWIFGRGTADMKGGGAIQLSLLKAFSLEEERAGNLILIAVPDEENLSAGMRHAVTILKRIKLEQGLDFRLMINSEPHERKDPEVGIVHQGSVAKTNWFVHVQGLLTHAGDIFSGVNPWSLMGRIVARTDLSGRFVDRVGHEVSVPPTWVHIQDSKGHYDISTPQSVIGYFNVLNFQMTPQEISGKLVDCCREAAGDFHAGFSEMQFLTQGAIDEPQAVKVVTFEEVLDKLEAMGKNRMARYKSHERQMAEKLKIGQISFMDATAHLVDLAVNLLEAKTALVVVGMMMPYYPGVCNAAWEAPEDFYPIIAERAMKSWGQAYENRNYFTGICDLSYGSFTGDAKAVARTMGNMPLWGSYYKIPFDCLAEICMPSINVGPWGKDLHQVGERVYREDLLERTPHIIQDLIRRTLEA